MGQVGLYGTLPCSNQQQSNLSGWCKPILGCVAFPLPFNAIVFEMAEARRLRGGIVGAGRSRNGLGPFLASHFEAAGGLLLGVVGRDEQRALAAAGPVAARLGHPIAAYGSLTALLALELDVLIIAAPVPVHLESLRAVCGTGVAVLCEKPLGMPSQEEALYAVLDDFLAAKQLLLENCQWPEVVPAWRGLYPSRVAEPVREVVMRLSPSGHSGMLEDSLSHLISLVQALVRIGAQTSISGLRVSPMPGQVLGRVYEFVLKSDSESVTCRLELVPCEAQPRPAWLAINGARMDRDIDLDTYQISFRSEHRSISVGDPLADLVYRFVECVRVTCSYERIQNESESIRQRARIYHRLLAGFDRES